MTTENVCETFGKTIPYDNGICRIKQVFAQLTVDFIEEFFQQIA